MRQTVTRSCKYDDASDIRNEEIVHDSFKSNLAQSFGERIVDAFEQDGATRVYAWLYCIARTSKG